MTKRVQAHHKLFSPTAKTAALSTPAKLAPTAAKPATAKRSRTVAKQTDNDIAAGEASPNPDVAEPATSKPTAKRLRRSKTVDERSQAPIRAFLSGKKSPDASMPNHIEASKEAGATIEPNADANQPTKKPAAKRLRRSKTIDERAATPPVPEPAAGQPSPKRLRSGRVTRSASASVLASVNANVDRPKRSARTSVDESTPKKKTGPMPFIVYSGAVEYYTRAAEIEAACEALCVWVDEQVAAFPAEPTGDDEPMMVPIAFDMEWPFSFQTGSGRTAVIQLCATVDRCFVLHVSQMQRLPASLLRLLRHERVRLHGVCVKNDLRKLDRDFAEVDSQPLVDRCRDLGVWCNQVCNTGGRWSMERLVAYLCRLQINKEGKVRRSQWDVQPLTKEQQIYAAIDVYIAQVMHIELERRERDKRAKEEQIVSEHGAKTLAAIKQLQ